MYVKKVKRKCNVRGCRCTDSFAISLSREVGNTVIICKSCLGKALGAIDEINPDTGDNSKNVSPGIPSLFFNAKALGVEEASEDAENKFSEDVSECEENENATEAAEELENDGEEEAEDASGSEECFVCPVCGKSFTSEKGLKAHMRKYKGKNGEEQAE